MCTAGDIVTGCFFFIAPTRWDFISASWQWWPAALSCRVVSGGANCNRGLVNSHWVRRLSPVPVCMRDIFSERQHSHFLNTHGSVQMKHFKEAGPFVPRGAGCVSLPIVSNLISHFKSRHCQMRCGTCRLADALLGRCRFNTIGGRRLCTKPECSHHG